MNHSSDQAVRRPQRATGSTAGQVVQYTEQNRYLVVQMRSPRTAWEWTGSGLSQYQRTADEMPFDIFTVNNVM